MERRRKVEEKAYSYIKNQIETDNWLEGKQIKELDIAKTLEISRTPIRNAFLRLEKEGFVSISPNKGVFVTSSLIELKGVKERLYYLEVLLQHVLYTLERSEIEVKADSYNESMNVMIKSVSTKANAFEEGEKQFWHAILKHHDNSYMNESIMSTLTSLISSDEYTRDIFENSRTVKLNHYKTIAELIGKQDYIYARREVRILLNQLLINLIQGVG